jgi:hypothetical protein
MYLYPIGQYGRMKMSQMIADTTDELVAMAASIGVQAKWLQKAGSSGEHFDIAQSKRDLALKLGAVAISMRQCSAMCVRRRIEKSLGKPEDAEAWRNQYAIRKESA